MLSVLSFLQELQTHNNRDWFEAHRTQYREAQQHFNAFTAELIRGVEAFDPSVRNVDVKDCTYRIYRDIRFSPDKSPYKNHFGAYICPGGRKSGYAGYYFHIEPEQGHYIGGSLLACGVYCPDKAVLASIREEICDQGEAFVQAVRQAEGFGWDEEYKLKKVPQGFPKDSPYADYLKYKDYTLLQYIPQELLADDRQLMQFCLRELKKTVAFNTILNRAVAYALGQ